MACYVQLILKRIFDVVVSLLVLILASPVILLIVLAIKLDDKGSAFFVQTRAGRKGRPFRCVKFRTMTVDAEKSGPGVAINDPRVTRIGSYLRRWTLDEIPQLFNVLKGDMSIVGPRPTLPSQVALYSDWEMRRLEVKPGMAGWAWIHGRNKLSWEKRIEMDIWYVDHWSFALDLRILFQAFWYLLKREGLYNDEGVTPTYKGL